MVGVAKWLRPRFVVPVFEGSIPFTCPIFIMLATLEDKIHHARSLSNQAHEERLVNYANIEALIKAQVQADPEKTFLIYHSDKPSRDEFSYQEIYDLVGKCIQLMQDCGISKGDRIATISHNHSDTVTQYLAAWSLGAVVVPINVNEDESCISYILSNSHCKLAFLRDKYISKMQKICSELPELKNLIITGEPTKADLESLNTEHCLFNESLAKLDANYQIKDAADLDSEALIVYTSGTTGNPKGVVLTHYNLLVDAKCIAEWHQMDARQRMMCVLPIHHVNGTIVTILTPLFFGGSLVLNEKFHTSEFFGKLAKEKVNVVSVVPTLLAFLLQGGAKTEGLDLSNFRHIICGAGPLTVELAKEFEEHYQIKILHGYGLSETTCYSCFLPVDLSFDEHRSWMEKYGFPSIGKELPNNHMDIHDENGKSLAEGEKGEIVIRGHNVMLHYFKNEKANQDTFVNGWFRSGDEGFYQLDKNGEKYFFITGRLKELIIRGGINVSPLEVDEIIMSIPGIKAGIAVGYENNMYGEEVGAYVELEENTKLSEQDVIDACAKELPFHKCPKVVIFGNDIPVTSTGKYQRNKLKPLYSEYKDVQFRKP